MTKKIFRREKDLMAKKVFRREKDLMAKEDLQRRVAVLLLSVLCRFRTRRSRMALTPATMGRRG